MLTPEIKALLINRIVGEDAVDALKRLFAEYEAMEKEKK